MSENITIQGSPGFGDGEIDFKESARRDSVIISIAPADGGLHSIRITRDELLEAARAFRPEVEPRSPWRSHEYVRETGINRTLEVGDRMGASHLEGRESVHIMAGNYGDNIVIKRDGKNLFTLGLASIEAIVDKFGLKPGPKVTIQPKPKPEPAWADAKVIKATFEDETHIFKLDEDKDYEFVSESDRDYLLRTEAFEHLSDVEILIGA